MSAIPPKSGPSVTAVIVIGSAVLLAIAGVIIALSVTLSSTHKPERDDADDEQPQLSEIVLDATWADGSALDADELDTVEEIITGRLEDAGITGFGLSVDDDQIHVIFDEDADEKTLETAADVLDVTFSADFRPVLEAGGLCDSDQDHTDYGPDEEVTLCDQDGFEALTLGPSEVSGHTIIGASTVKPKNGDYWGVAVVFDSTGANALADMSQRLVGAPEGQNRLAIVLDGEVLASPTVTGAITDGEVGITGSFDEAQAEALAEQLRFASKGLVLSVDSTTVVK